MFPTTCATSASLSEPAMVGNRHTMPARSSSVGIPSKAIGFPGIMFATLGVSTAGCLGPNPYHPSPKVTNIPQIKSPLRFYGTSGLLPLINLFLGQLLTLTTRTLPPSLLFHALFLIPFQAHNIASTVFWRDNQKIAGSWEGNTV